MTQLQRWSEELRAWVIPPEILAAAPRDPYEFPADVIRRPTIDPLVTPTGEAVAMRLEAGERLLDVGVGAGRIAGAFAERHDVVGVEPRPGLAAESRERGISVIEGSWPDAAAQAGTAPVVLCTHVLYDVQQPEAFLQALHQAAERRVVIEVTAAHPWVPVGPLYQVVHGIDRPEGPAAELLAGVISEVLGLRPQVVRWDRPGRTYDDVEAYLDHQRRMVCIDRGHPRAEALDALAMDAVEVDPDGRAHLPPVAQATMWWDTDGGPLAS